MREIAEDANVSFDAGRIIYIPKGRGWIGYADAPKLPNDDKDKLDNAFEEELGDSVDFATGETQDKLDEWVDADATKRDELEKNGYPP